MKSNRAFTSAISALAIVTLVSNLGSISHATEPLIVPSSETNVAQIKPVSTTPQIITQFFDTLVNKGSKEAFKFYAESMNNEAMLEQNSEISISMSGEEEHATLTPEEAAELLDIMFSMFGEMLDNEVGDCLGYTILDSLALGDRTQIIYVVSEHENKPMFWNVTVYKPDESTTMWRNIPTDGWVIANFQQKSGLNTDIIPSSVLDKWTSESE